jgi:hypothetical protein
MGILDEAIREHLELKRQHGAADSELKQLEDEAFGQAQRPGDEAVSDAEAEAPTQFMTQPEAPEEPSSRREPPSIADLQEPPPPPAEEQPAMEHEVVADAPEAASHSTAEREAIAEQPTEMYDVEEELGPPSPSDEEIVEEEIAEPRLAPTDPLAGLEEDEEAEVSIAGPAPDDDEEYEDEDDAFWNEQRLSDELDQALEAPRDTEPEPKPELVDEPEPVAEAEPEARRDDDDVLEATPDFLEETPEDDQLWFEQKPPKDFNFDD